MIVNRCGLRGLSAFVTASILSTTPLFAQATPPPAVTSPPVAAEVATSGADALPSVSSLFTGLGRDVRRLPSRETAIILGVVGAASLGLRGQDPKITTHLSTSDALDPAFELGEVLGGAGVQAGAAVVTYAAGRLFESPKTARVGADLVRAQILNSAFTQSIKLSVRRVRPDGTRFSFPSGHASAAFATASVFGRHFGWRVGAPAYGLATYVAASRLQENRHFLTDVAIGAAIGVVTGRAVSFGRGATQMVVSPVASAGVVGLIVTWTPER